MTANTTYNAPVKDRTDSLAIETSCLRGSVALGRGRRLLEAVALEQTRRHNVELMPAIDDLCRRHEASPATLEQVYVSIGPGSFTGLRIAVATAKMLALAAGAKLVAVPTIATVIANVPAIDATVAVCMSAKRQHRRMYVGLYRHDDDDWRAEREPTLMTPESLCAEGPRPLAILGEHLPEHDWPADVTLLDAALATPGAETVWRLGQALAAQGGFADPWALVPLYVRKPEVEEKQEQSPAFSGRACPAGSP